MDERYETEDKLNALAQELYRTSDRCFTPQYPWVFVRVLPKEQVTDSGIVLPMLDQNKTVHEGIVLATWGPVEAVPMPRRDEGAEQDWRAGKSTRYHGEHKESALTPGDHVLFHFYAGAPIEGFSDKRYRVIKECDWKQGEEGGIFGKVNHPARELRIQAQLERIIRESCEQKTEFIRAALYRKLREHFLLVERGGYSVTLSGR